MQEIDYRAVSHPFRRAKRVFSIVFRLARGTGTFVHMAFARTFLIMLSAATPLVGSRLADPHSAQPPAAAELRIPAHAGYLFPDSDGARVGKDRDVAPFTGPKSSLSWFGEFKDAGEVIASVVMTVPKGDTLTLLLTGDQYSAELHSITYGSAVVTGTGNEERVTFRGYSVGKPSLERFTLFLPDRDSAPAVRVAALILEGAPLGTARFNLDARRNAASVHLRYTTDSTELVTGFYNEVVGVEDPVTTYYMATGFARGYFGMQVNSKTERRIIFSVWDAGDGTSAKDRSTVKPDDFTQLVAKGEGVVADVFGNEGTGGHSHLVYNWKTGSTQKFFVTAELAGTHTTYSGYWFHPEKKAWQLIASFRAAKDGKGLRRLYSFSENFGGSTGHLVRKALFGPQWIRMGSGEWRELTTASFTHDATGKENRLDRFMGVENGRFFLQHGGFVEGFTASGQTFTRVPSGAPPRIELPKP